MTKPAKWKDPWALKVWVVWCNGVPHDWRLARSTAFKFVRELRLKHPHARFTVSRQPARLQLETPK